MWLSLFWRGGCSSTPLWRLCSKPLGFAVQGSSPHLWWIERVSYLLRPKGIYTEHFNCTSLGNVRARKKLLAPDDRSLLFVHVALHGCHSRHSSAEPTTYLLIIIETQMARNHDNTKHDLWGCKTPMWYLPEDKFQHHFKWISSYFFVDHFLLLEFSLILLYAFLREEHVW